ncbi:MAG: pyridoxal phosphate-dependent aminotransferase [Hyphomicrobiaceae bacterium]
MAQRPTDSLAGLAAAASARSEIPSFIVMDVMRAAAAAEAEGRRIIHMEVGQPGTAAPRAAREALKHALDRETLGYTLALGMEPLRARIARLYGDWYGLDIAPSRIVVTSGSSAAFVLAFLALFDAGDTAGLPAPGYPCYRHILTALGCRPINIETGPADRWMPTPEGIDQAITQHQLKGLLLASPANPTGTMLEPERLATIADVCRARGVWFVSDEIYHGLTYGMPARSALCHLDDAVVINSFSKYFSMTGWRVGWMVVPERLVRPIERLAQNLYISAPAAAQVAALGAFDGLDELEANRAVYAANRELLLREMPKAGFDRIVPADGAFYLYCDISGLSVDSLAFTRRMLDEAGVAATPGLDFDEVRGGQFVRFSYAGPTDAMVEAIERLKAWRINAS